MNTDELEAGRELDALVANRVMDMCTCRHTLHTELSSKTQWYCAPVGIKDGEKFDSLPYYSTDIAIAFELVHRMLDGAFIFELEFSGFRWWCRFDPDPLSVVVSANTAPLAICRAALKAMEAS